MSGKANGRRVRRGTVRALIRGWLAALTVTLTCGAAIVAHATWQARHMGDRMVRLSIAVPPPPVRAVAAREIAAPATGVTGTIALPPPPGDAATRVAGDVGVTPARSFSLAGIGATDRGRALECLTAAIYYEAASEPIEGQQAVAQAVLNRVRHPAFPATVCGVVYQGAEHAGCQFSFACDGAMQRPIAAGAWARASRIAVMALNGYVYAGVGLATHYHTYAVTPAWNRSLVMTDVVGAHFFHRWKGYWGTAAAFGQRYRGGEPVPGVAPPAGIGTIPIVLPAPLIPADTVAVMPAHQDQLKPARISPDAPVAAPSPAADRLPPASEVLEKWRNSGQPIVPERSPPPAG